MSSATNLYLDLAYNKDPNEIGYYWAGFVDTKKTFFYRPLNLYQSMLEDRMGNRIDQEAFKDMEHLNKDSERRILGLQGLLWGENSKGEDLLEYQAIPKLLEIAERAWNMNMPKVEDMDKEWNKFSKTLGDFTLPFLDTLDANYRIPLPGGIIKSGILKMNTRFQGLRLEYSQDFGETWALFNKGDLHKVKGGIVLRSVNSNRTRFSRETIIV